MKRKTLEDLKTGQKFRYDRKLYIKADSGPVQLSNGYEPEYYKFPDETLVTPVKVKITIVD